MKEKKDEPKLKFTEEETEKTYQRVRGYVITAQDRIYHSVNSAMVEAYWKIGKEIYEACGGSIRAEYGKQLIQGISERLTKEFGKGFTAANLRNMRQFYLSFQKHYTVCSELSWSHYRILMRIA